MNPTLTYLLARKMWLIPGVAVWGELASFEAEFISTENDGSAKRILHSRCFLGGAAQTIAFADLTDHRGNKLPATILNASVVVIPRGNVGVVVQGSVAPDSFRLARVTPSTQAVSTDLLIVEMG